MTDKERALYKIKYKHKLPRKGSKVNYIGIEFEFYSEYSRDYVSDIILGLGIGACCNLGSDGSIRPPDIDSSRNIWGDYIGPYHTMELRVLCTENNYENILSKLQVMFSSIGAGVNESCGLHVHLDMRNRNKDQCYELLWSHENTLKKMVESHRLNNEYCLFEKTKGNKYTAINYNISRPTIEVRCHQGTVDMTATKNWIDTLLLMVEGKYTKQKKG